MLLRPSPSSPLPSATPPQDTIAPLAELSPEFALQYLVLDLLTSDTPDCVVAGLKALQVGWGYTVPCGSGRAADGGRLGRKGWLSGCLPTQCLPTWPTLYRLCIFTLFACPS